MSAPYAFPALPPGPTLRREPLIHEGALLDEVTLGAWCEIGAHAQIRASRFGAYSYCCEHCDIIYTSVGAFANIAAYVRINPGMHPLERACQHHILYRRSRYGLGADDEAFFAGRRHRPCHIGHDTWIGHGVTIMPGVTIGNGAVIGSGAVVTKDVPPYQIAAGVPARLLRPRFDTATAAALDRIAWWDWPDALIRERLDEFADVPAFIKRYDC